MSASHHGENGQKSKSLGDLVREHNEMTAKRQTENPDTSLNGTHTTDLSASMPCLPTYNSIETGKPPSHSHGGTSDIPNEEPKFKVGFTKQRLSYSDITNIECGKLPIRRSTNGESGAKLMKDYYNKKTTNPEETIPDSTLSDSDQSPAKSPKGRNADQCDSNSEMMLFYH